MVEIIVIKNGIVPVLERTAACIGYFDAFHKGHQKLIRETIAQAKKEKILPALICFSPDPVSIIQNKKIPHLFPDVLRYELAHHFGIEKILQFEFNEDLMNMDPSDFIMHDLNRLNLSKLICGFDFTYGYQGKGNAKTLSASSIATEVVDSVDDAGMKISSARIRRLLHNGDIESANRLLIQPYSICGEVIYGRQIGSTIGFPTANIKVSADKCLPLDGVYAAVANIDGHSYSCMVNIGHNPTLCSEYPISVEAHILDFDSDIYGRILKVSLIRRIRDEIRFDSLSALKAQLAKDKETAEKLVNLWYTNKGDRYDR